ncbi:2-dehydropantoate 2-reductase [Vibrio mediterranei]|uniref:2-dehydropantoate 2-reductase n=1 Tax=Vibrio mediterranei TaxID=689 RepID=UPI00148B4A1C|nr:2-dehydropantoate 2-reductase [Vibrio mediterranei]NOH30869.1 2-dehydropantoate 2-reductase [Vibrio mediterranei]
MNITILGPGAIGSLYAYKLHQAGHRASVWGRSPQDTVVIELDGGSAIHLPNCDVTSLKASDLVIVTLKAWQVELALKPLLKHLNCDTILLFLHNGMGTVEHLETAINHHPVLLGTSTHGALKLSSSQVRHTGLGQTFIGAWNDKGSRCSFIADVLDHAFKPVAWNSEIQTALWSKLVINCAINPLTAINNCQNGELTHKDYQQQIAMVVREATECANKMGVALKAEEMLDTVYKVIHATAQNYSSMHQDIYNKRQSEIDYITGYVVSISKRYGIAVPTNLALYHQIKQIESSWNQHD